MQRQKKAPLAVAAVAVAVIVLHQQNFTVRMGPGPPWVCLDAFGCGVISFARYPPPIPDNETSDETAADDNSTIEI